jgi:preprotein translocase subunit SecY
MPETMLRRICITLGAVLIYRTGLYIPLPGIKPAIWDQIFRTDSTFGSLGPLFTSGGIHRLSIFGMGIFSYIAAAVVLQLATVVSPRLAALRQQGWRGRQIVVRRTRYLTTLFATFQACALALALNKDNVASDPGLPFIISTAVTLTGGTMFLVWLSEQITLRGVGNGIAVILFANLVAGLPHAIARTFMLVDLGAVSSNVTAITILMSIGFIALIVTMELARRRLPIRFLAREVGNHRFHEHSSYLPLKLNSAGIVPVVLASWSLFVLAASANSIGHDGGTWLSTLANQFLPGRPTYLILYAILIVFFAFFYTALVLDPDEMADGLKKVRGGSVTSVPPWPRARARGLVLDPDEMADGQKGPSRDREGRGIYGHTHRRYPLAHHGNRCWLSGFCVPSAGSTDRLGGSSL